MSNLKYLTLEQLRVERASVQKTIDYHKAKVNGQTERLKWVEKYILLASPPVAVPLHVQPPIYPSWEHVVFGALKPGDTFTIESDWSRWRHRWRAVRKDQVLQPEMTGLQKFCWLFGYKMSFKVLEKFKVGEVEQ